MLYAAQDKRIVQPIKVMILRTRVQQAGTGIFYHVDLRRETLVPEDPSAWFDHRKNVLGQAGLSSQIGSKFSEVPPGLIPVHLYAMVGTIVETPEIKVHLTESDEVVTINPTEKRTVCSFEILAPDVRLLQEQNQMALVLEMNAILQFNAQDYGEGFDADGRDREILQGSIWAVPQYYNIGVGRPEARSAASSAEEVHEIAEKARKRNEQRALSARSQSWANRATRDELRAKAPMPPRRGTNTAVQVYGGSHFGAGVHGVPYGE